MSETRVKIQSIIENQIPNFIAEESPLLVEFLKQYYISQEYQGGSYDLIQNIDEYTKLDNIFQSVESTVLLNDISFSDTSIATSPDTFTKGFPDRYGIIKINDEIITYTSKTNTTFEGCIRGFSGVTSYSKTNNPDELVFSSSVASDHSSGTVIQNLSGLFLQEFLKKIKYQFIPGFSERNLSAGLDQNLFIKQSKDFYSSKGTDESFKILFSALYGEKVEVIKPRDYLFKPSDAGYRRTKDLVVESISGNPLDLLNSTLYQDTYENYGIENSYASITNVEKIFIGGKEYFKLSFDSDYNKDLVLDGTLYGNFSLHPKTRVVTQAPSGSTVIDVDSTVGFPQTGVLITKNSDGTELVLNYDGKSTTQFYNVTGVDSIILPSTEIRLDVYAYGYSGIGTENQIRVRIGSVLNEIVIPDNTYLFSKNDTIRIKSLGISSATTRRNDWIDNISNTYKVKNTVLIDNSNFTYNIVLFDPHNFRIGDDLKITDSSSVEKNATVVDVLDEFTISITGQGQLSLNKFYILNRYIKKTNSTKYPQLNVETANVQNTYTNFSDEILVASQSIPFYYDQVLNPYNKKITISGEFSGEVLQIIPDNSDIKDHGFFTGDKVYYSPQIEENLITAGGGEEFVDRVIVSKFPELEEGLYYVKRVDATKISLAKSPSDLFENKFISVSGTVESNTIEYYDFFEKNLRSQNIFREIKHPINKSGNYQTFPGKVGILVNGVEILNYKSSETLFYGQIDSIDVTSPGEDYDVLNPPSLDIIDYQGVGATGICAVKGNLKNIQILDSGFDYVNTPTINILGGNGKDASAEVNMTLVEHNVYFNASSTSSNVNLFTDTIGFSTYHKFRDYERVIYLTDGQTGVVGLTTEASYFVSVIDGFNIKLHAKESEAITGINTVNINDYGVGIHRFKSAIRKKIISDIIVTNSGNGYENKERTTSSSGINTSIGTINITSHQYNTGEEVVYSTTGTVVGGLSTSSNYLVKKVDNNSFKLAPVGLGTVSKSYYLDTEQYIKLNSVGSGLHSFNYPQIIVTVNGNIGVSTLSNQDFSAKVQPIFRGGIESVHLTDNGSNYGSEEIINYNRQPIFSLRSGSGAQVTVVTENNRISEVLVVKRGSGYNSPPNLVINGSGNYAKLVPVIENGELVEVKVLSGGIGYVDGTSIDVLPSGFNCRFFANLQAWTVNLFQKYFNTVTQDDGVVTLSDRDDYGLQYCHLYAPRKLRESVYAKSRSDGENLTLYGITDLRKVANEEVSSAYHSPIIGWSYDGNPIYGPYGYSTPTGGSVKAMLSGYELVTKENRPSFAYFPQGFFNEDYEFKGNGDLDIHNGRFCVTPDYPNGVYAYFSTINPNSNDSDGPFKGNRRPIFPYFIGNSFYSRPNEFNFKKQSNQNEYDLNNSNWFRNTTNYKLTTSNSSYDYIFDPDKVKNQTVNVNFASFGSIESIGILTGGSNYKVGDILVFDNSGTGGSNASSKVERIFGKDVTNVSASTTSFSSVEFATSSGVGEIIGFATLPHGLKNLETVNVSGLNTYFSNIEGSYIIGIRTDNFITTLGIQTTGITGLTTYFYVSGLLDFPYIRENDILGIGTQEKVKVLNVDKKSNRIRVLREYDSTVSSAYTASTVLFEDPRKFRISTGFKTDYSYNVNREIYFEPKESVGIGSTTAVGVGTTVVFSSPGIGVTQLFIPAQSIYLPNHQLKTGEKVTYSTNGGSEILAFNGSSYFALSQSQDLYVANISNDFIGVSTVKIGLSTEGTFIGIGSTSSSALLFFDNFGTGSYHSFKTKNNSILGEISKNVITVATASTHGLSEGDLIDFVAVPKNEEVITIKYNDINRRVVIDTKSFTTGDVNVSDDTIYIQNHGLRTGDKVIYSSSSPSGGLINESIYYVLYYTKDKIRLCETKYDLNLNIPNYIDITSVSSGTISPINPQIGVYKNKTIRFDLSDSSLSSINGSTNYSAFKLNFYYDPEFKYSFEATGTTNNFEIVRNGKVGIDTSASVSILLNDYFPNVFYYKLENANVDFIGEIKKQIVDDTEVYNHNQINLVNSKYSGMQRVVGVGTTNTFEFNLREYPEESSYTKFTSNLYYTTNSLNAYGPISKVSILSGGSNYEFTPGISTVISSYGSGAIFEVNSKSIGKIVKTEIEDIGFDYPTDLTLNPSLNLPEILQIEPLTSFKSIGVTYGGKNYLTSPGLVVIDGYTNKIVNDVDLRYKIGDPSVKIVKNTYGMFDTTPRIIPINNSNGIGINNISYNSTTKDVTVGFNTGFSDEFPFSIGDKILIENTSVGVGSTARGFNSSEYGYNLFTITSINPALGGNTGSITYNISDYLLPNEFPGTFSALTSFGRVIPEKYFPTFDIKLKKNDFLIGEKVSSESGDGIVESWNNKIEYLKVSTNKELKKGDILVGESSNTKGLIKRKIDFDSYAKLGTDSSVNKGWQYDTGILNNNVQRIADNNYYQYFSYSLKSRVPLETWNDSVSSLNHTTGFLKFSDLIVESQEERTFYDGVFPIESVTDTIVDIIGNINLNCINVFDLASERAYRLGSGIISDEILFQNRILTDYFESVGNRVLIIDDISDQFNSNPRSTRFSTVNEFELDSARTKKYFTFVRDKRFTLERQILVVSLLHDDEFGYLNQYGRVDTYLDLGSFDFSISGTLGQLNFYPIKYSVNDYDISCVSHDLRSTVTGIGQSFIGDIVNINSNQATIPSGSSSAVNIVSIANTYRSSKILVEIGGTDGSYYEFDELNVIHDGTNIDLLEYGQLTSDTLVSGSSPGLGTYIPYFDGSNLKIDFKPNSTSTVNVDINTLNISIASSTSGAVGVGTEELNTALVSSGIATIAASPTPLETIVTEYPNNHSCAYYIVSVEDTTNQRYQMSEVIVIDDGSEASITEFGILQTHSSLGTVGAAVSTNGTQITFTPEPSIDVEVRVFQNALGLVKENILETSIDLTNAEITTGNGFYEGTEKSVRRSFDLTHNQNLIFQRYFDGSDSNIVDINSDTIRIPDHYFVSGEEVIYAYAGAGTTQAIGIAQTVVTGIGLTNKLPSSVYIVKLNESTVRLAATAEDALKSSPLTFDITSVGIGTSHTFIAKNQNTKNIIAIDNYFQSPIVGSSITTTLGKDISIFDNRLTFTGITSFFSGNLIQINNEIMKINTVGLGSTNVILVDRPWMGTGLSTHSAGDLIRIIEGNYNIIDSTIHFVEAPYGPTPIGSITNPPNDRDWTGITTHSTFQGRTFLRTGRANTSQETYSTNYIFNNVSNAFNGYDNTFTLTSNNQNVTGFSTNNAIVLINGVFQGPQGEQAVIRDYTLIENSGISSIRFTGTASSVGYDVNNSNLPVGGVIVSVGSSSGFGLQPLISAGGTAIVSTAGTIASISIGNSGSGYRVGIQTIVNVGVQTESVGTPNITFIGTASVSNGHIIGIAITNPGFGYTTSNPPIVVFDDPLSYSDIPLIYSSSSTQGSGSEAKIDIVVGQGSSVIDFTIKNTGYGYGQGEILTFDIGGNSGIQTDISKPYSEFQVTIDKTYSDNFSGWVVGELQVLDSFEDLFDGVSKKFPLKFGGNLVTIRAAKGSIIDVRATLLIFLNDILQKPGEAYLFEGGSVVEFSEAPKNGDTVKVLFYKGSGDIDVVFRDILETAKVGDELTLNSEPGFGQGIGLQQEGRVVIGINTTDSVQTNPYTGPGITTDETLLRPVKWCKQTSDRIINGRTVGKDRVQYEPLINPSSYLINATSIGSTTVYVDNVKPFFNAQNESPLLSFQNQVTFTSQDSLVAASATAVVSSAGTISSIIINDGGYGYDTAPIVTIENPVGLAVSYRATASSTISSGVVDSISVTGPGTGYSIQNPPMVLIEPPTLLNKVSNIASYGGDSGIIVGVGTTSLEIIFDLFIPTDSFLRDTNIVGSAITISTISEGDFFIVYNSNIGSATTSVNSLGISNQIIGIGTEFLDNVYQVSSAQDIVVNIIGIGTTSVRRVYVRTGISTIDFSFTDVTFDSTSYDFSSIGIGTGVGTFLGISTSNYYGNFSWGKIVTSEPLDNGPFNSYTLRGIGGITTSAFVNRTAPLKYLNYTS